MFPTSEEPNGEYTRGALTTILGVSILVGGGIKNP